MSNTKQLMALLQRLMDAQIEERDCLTLGAPSTGQLKVQVNFNNVKATSEKLETAVRALKATKDLINTEFGKE